MGLTHILVIFCFLSLVQVSNLSKTQPETPLPLSDTCNGIFLSYTPTLGRNNLTNLVAKILNNGLEEPKSWILFTGFQNAEFLVLSANVVLADVIPLLMNTCSNDASYVVFAGFSNTDWKTAIEIINVIGTIFGVKSPVVPMPANIALMNDGFACDFITTMKATYSSIVHSRDCLFGPQVVYYKDMDFDNKTNDSTLGGIPFCCRNETILPPLIDPSSRTGFIAPQNFQINGTLNPKFKCGIPKLVIPSLFPDISGLPINKIAVKSWKVVPKCFVSSLVFYNKYSILCKTCACGCSKQYL
ncbi:hypothetical protein MKW92_006888 [Papaver armeniacum]|nr:hypothetical protein MKW92_006888 [Papaver armeniacum]